MFWAMGDAARQAEDDATKDVGFEGLLSVGNPSTTGVAAGLA